MLSDLKPFSYCVTVGCWRKKSRWGRPGPAGLKDHSNPAEEAAGNALCDWFWRVFTWKHRASVSRRSRWIKITTAWTSENLKKRWLVWRYFTLQCHSWKGRMGTLQDDGSQWGSCFPVTQLWLPMAVCYVRCGFWQRQVKEYSHYLAVKKRKRKTFVMIFVFLIYF